VIGFRYMHILFGMLHAPCVLPPAVHNTTGTIPHPVSADKVRQAHVGVCVCVCVCVCE